MSPRTTLALALAALLAAPVARPQPAGGDDDRLRAAKALVLDREYEQARRELQALRRSAGGAEARTALFWIARCSESLGELSRAFGEYGEYLATRPAERTYAEEARTSRVALAAKLYKAGERGQIGVARAALADPSRTVRYFAALQLASLGPDVGRPAVPVLKEILAREKDEDLVERAKLALLRVDRAALAEAVPPPPPHAGARPVSWIRVRIYERGASRPGVSINLPVALAEMVFKSLPDEARAELHRKGYDAGSFWDRLKRTGPTDILTVEGDGGERVQIWIE